MSYHQAAQHVPEEEMAWVSGMAALSYDEHAEAPQRMSSVSHNLNRSETTLEGGTQTWQHQSTMDTIQEGSASNSPGPEHGSSSRQSTTHDNPLGLSHQSSQYGIHRVPIPEGAAVVASPGLSNTEPPSGMPSPDETLIGGSSPRRVSRWGRLWNFGVKSLHLNRSSSDTLLMNMEPIAGAKRPSIMEQAACDGTPPGPYHKHCYNNDPEPCSSIKDVQLPSRSFALLNVIVSLYSTAGSVIWLVIAFRQPRWGHSISSRMGLGPSTATTLTAGLSKSIEITFVTTFITFMGQSLTRRAISRGMTLAELYVRNWVIQPGTLLTEFGLLKNALFSVRGALSLLAALAAAFFTTASDAMVSPKLKYGDLENRTIEGYVRASYGNANFVKMSCPTMLSELDGSANASVSCTDVMISGESYRNLQAFMGVWTNINSNGSNMVRNLRDRPAGTASLNGNITLYGSWIETEHSNVTAHFEETGRIINNVTLAMPHPGVVAAAAAPMNNILQPWDLSGVGEYVVKAGVVSPAVNVMCVNMAEAELSPLIYTEWPNAKTNKTESSPKIGWEKWSNEIPSIGNKTVVDDIFHWGAERQPPAFRVFPADYNTVVNPLIDGQRVDAIYILGKSPNFANYTLCELRSWVSPNCSTQFNISGLAGSKMWAHCEDPNDRDSYHRSFPAGQGWSFPDKDWTLLAGQWRSASDLNGGERKSDPANSRILTQLVLKEPNLSRNLPSMAEAIAVFASSTLILASVGTPFRHYWPYDKTVLGDPGMVHPFNASVMTQEYTSGHVYSWQRWFYVILILIASLNVLCLVYILTHLRKVTDYTEAQNLFSLALNSAPNEGLRGTCGGGPEKEHMAVPLRVGYDSDANHYFIEQAGQGSWRKGMDGQSYAKLRNSRSWI